MWIGLLKFVVTCWAERDGRGFKQTGWQKRLYIKYMHISVYLWKYMTTINIGCFASVIGSLEIWNTETKSLWMKTCCLFLTPCFMYADWMPFYFCHILYFNQNYYICPKFYIIITWKWTNLLFFSLNFLSANGTSSVFHQGLW